MRPSWPAAAVRLLEAATFDVLLRARLNQQHGPFLGSVVEPAVRQGHGTFRRAMFGIVVLVPQNVPGFEVQTDERSTLIAPIRAVKAAVEQDHAAMVILHFSGGINFSCLDSAIRIFAQLCQSAARAVCRGRKYLAVMVKRRGTVYAHGVRGTVIVPKKFAVGRCDSDEPSAGELHILPLPIEINRDDGRVSSLRVAGHLTLPESFASQFVEGHEGHVLAAGRADHLVTINQGRFAKTPGRQNPAKVLLQAALPKDFSVFDLKAAHIASHAFNIEPFPIDGRCASRSLLSLRPAFLFESRSKARNPKLFAILFGQSPDDFVAAAIAHAENLATGDGRSAVAATEPFYFPGERRAILGPLLQQARLFRDAIAIRPLPLRPIIGRGSEKKDKCRTEASEQRLCIHI